VADLVDELHVLAHLLSVQRADEPDPAFIASVDRGSQIAGGPLGRRRRVVQFMGETGREAAEGGQLLVLEHGALEGAGAGHDPGQQMGGREAVGHDHPHRLFRDAQQPAIAGGADTEGDRGGLEVRKPAAPHPGPSGAVEDDLMALGAAGELQLPLQQDPERVRHRRLAEE
jgi:hypothetical protein